MLDGKRKKAARVFIEPAEAQALAVGLLLAAALTLAAPLWAGEVLMSRSGFDNWIEQKMLPREQALDVIEARAAALESRLAAWENLNLSRLYLWPGESRVEYYGPGGAAAGSGSLDVPPRIVDGRTLVPLRFVGEALGAEVVWNGEARQVAYISDRTQILMTVGQTGVLINGRGMETDMAPMIIDGRTMVPVRFVSQWLGAVVKWDDAQKRVEIGYIRYNLQE